MARKGDIQEGPARRSSGYFESYLHRFSNMGQIATDGGQYTPVATVGTTAVAILTEAINPELTLGLKKIELGLTARFINRKADNAGTLHYYWQMRRDQTGTLQWCTLTPTMGLVVASGVGSLTDDTVMGYAEVASLPQTPLEIKLTTVGYSASSFTCQVKSSSYVLLTGKVVPGT